MSTEVQIRMDSAGQNLLVGGVALVLVFFLVLGIANQPLGMLLGLGIFFIIIGIWRRKHPLVIFRQDYFETKIAPAAGHHKVLYSEVVKAEITPKQLLNLYYQPHNARADAAPKRIKINLKVLKEPERELCRKEFHARLPEPVFSKSD